jgi:xylan 1,4-beta-xylosidase
LRLQGIHPKHARISVVDPAHGDIHAAYQKMGSPRYPTQEQIEQLKKAAELPAPEVRALKNGELTLTLPSYGLALVQPK